jgi:hypothetical protein
MIVRVGRLVIILLLLQLRNSSVTLLLIFSARSPRLFSCSCCLLKNNVYHCSIYRIVAIGKLMLSTGLLFRSEMKQVSAFCVFVHSHARPPDLCLASLSERDDTSL